EEVAAAEQDRAHLEEHEEQAGEARARRAHARGGQGGGNERRAEEGEAQPGLEARSPSRRARDGNRDGAGEEDDELVHAAEGEDGGGAADDGDQGRGERGPRETPERLDDDGHDDGLDAVEEPGRLGKLTPAHV